MVREGSERRLAWTLGLVLLYMTAEVAGGLITGSLALLADAGHMLSDAASLGLALFALRLARRPADDRRTFGYHRVEILAALSQGVVLVCVAVYILFEAWQRFREPPPVMGSLMMAVAGGGLVVNLVGLRLLHDHQKESLNVRGAWLHVLADTAGSVGAMVAALLIWWRGWTRADPIASVLIALLVLASSWRLLQQSVAVLMESAPGHLDVDEVRATLAGLEGVVEVHHLHLWTITSGLHALSVHLGLDEEAAPEQARSLLQRVQRTVRERFGVDHVTVQLEPPSFDRDREEPG